MSHIKTTPHASRGGFGALPQSHVPNGDLGDYESRHEYDGREYEQRYDERHDDSHTQGSYETLPAYGNDRPWPRARSDYTQISTSYKPDMITYTEAIGNVAPIMDRERPNYKPSALRWPFLTTLLAVILALVGLIAWALHVLPVLDNQIGVFTEGLRAREVVAYTSSVTVTDIEPAYTPAPLAARANTSSGSDASPTIPMTPIQSDFGNIGDQTVSETLGPSTTPPPTTTTKHGADSGSTAWSKPQSDFGNIGGQVTVSETMPPTLPTQQQSNYGDVGTVKVSELDKTPEVTPSPPSSNYGHGGSVSVSETAPAPTPTFVTPVVTVITNSEGVTTTSTSIPDPVSTPQTTTLTDSQGRPTATQETTVLVTPSVVTQTDSSGIPTATATLYPVIPEGSDNNKNNNNTVMKTYFTSHGDYVIGMFLPTFLAIILAIPIRILDLNAKILQPWHELTHTRGAAGRESLCLDTSGWQSVVASFRSLAGGQALVFLTSVLVLASALLIPLSAEAIAFDLRGIGCVKGSGNAQNCAYVLSVFKQAANATLAVLAVMGVAVFMILVILVRWRSGVSTNPWSMCGIASLSMNADVRRLFTSLPAGVDMAKMPKGLLQSILQDHWYKLGYFYGPNGTVEYGIMLHDERGDGYAPDQIAGDVKEPQDHHAAPTKPSHHLPFLMLGYAGRSVLLFVLCGLLALILYYNNTGGDTPFENFMDSESFGVRFLFTGVGVVISFFWASFFSSIAILSPYQLLAKSPQHARRSILLAPPTNAFSGLWSSVRRRHGFLAVVALTSILSEFLTIFLSNIPFRITQTFLIHNICTWAAVGILCIMILVVAGSFFVTWPHMPVDPSTVAGAMYYVCDSWMLARFEGLSTMKRKDRDWRVNEMGLKYEFGEITGSSGIVRVSVDASSSSGNADWAL
ncbi:hypothetical protein F4821DRAFT_225422 [Hypoxylon rubiginosum]|uniref:Uncharacterized protein n=1 Tax=Hypoxylon rubiginosum TaxID=110542 RepID=A0ACC0DFS9_9PEZI|nr:hypothetical protein F4821DRAFT_225422 [Hypoxylon rubiginosum]